MDMTARKTALRKQAFAARARAFATASVDAANAALVAEIGPVTGKVIAGYMAMRTELDPTPAMTALAGGNRLCVPVIVGKGQPLAFREWVPGCAMLDGPFGARVPAGGAWLEPAILIVPLVAFDRDYAAARGLNIRQVDFATMALVLAVTVVGLKIVGLILIVALLIIPPVTARFWTDRTERVWQFSGLIGGLSAYTGAAISASAPQLPTGPLIVLTGFAVFVVSLAFAPGRGVLAAGLRHISFQRRVHMRQGLLALAQGQPIYERYTIRLLMRAGLARADGVATEAGRAGAAKALLDEHRWEILRTMSDQESATALYDGMRAIETVVTRDQLSEIDARLTAPRDVPA